MVTMKSGRLLGQILLDGGFLSDGELTLALAEQKRTNELLGRILVRMGIISAVELNAALSVQEHVGDLELAISSAAGVRQMLGSLLVAAGQISDKQLDEAIAQQRASGERLGELLIRRGMLSAAQLDCLLKFQQNQGEKGRPPNPFRLGELMVTSGYLSAEQLDAALRKQDVTGKRLGEVLVDEGYAASQQVEHGLQLQQRLIAAALAAILSFAGMSLTGCGSTAENGDESTVVAQQGSVIHLDDSERVQAGLFFRTNYLVVTDNDFGLLPPTFYYSTVNQSFWSIQANLARSVTDPDATTVMRIDIEKSGDKWPRLNRKFSIEENDKYAKFPGTVLVLNGARSTRNRVERGTIFFSRGSVAQKSVRGSFDLILTDYDSGTVPPPQYKLKGIFSFTMGEYGPA